jgi:TolB-like protein/Tfp pilus assembly protein PilF
VNPRDTPKPGTAWSTGYDEDGVDAEALSRFPQVFSSNAGIPDHQLGWRMAVLPFRSIGAPLGHGIALGMAEEISTALSRFRLPRLVASATFWNGTEPVDDAMGRCRMYALDYIIDGTIKIDGSQITVHVTLMDVVLAFEVIWSGRFDGTMDDLFSLQHRIVSETVAQIDPELFQRGSAYEAPCKTEVAAAHHSVLTAIQGIFRLDKASFMKARELLSHAIELDPDYAAAYTWMAYWCIMAMGQGWAENPREIAALAGDVAKRAVQLDPLDARALTIAGHIDAYMFKDVPKAAAMHARALELNPNLPIAWTLSSLCKIYSGEHATAIRYGSISKSLSPRDPHIFFTEHTLMSAYMFDRQLEQAEILSDIVLARNTDHVSAVNIRLAILGHLGRKAEATECFDILRKLEPFVTVASIVSRAPLRKHDQAYYARGLMLAGVPTR